MSSKVNQSSSAAKANNAAPKGAASSSSVWRSKDAASKATQQASGKSQGKLIFVPKMQVKEQAEEKTAQLRILPRMGMREVINYGIGKVREDWTLTFEGYQMEIAKILKIVEIIKTRITFLHQYSEFINEEMPVRKGSSEEGEEEEQAKRKFRAGIKVTLSRVPFDVPDQIGYQKPKPRIFLQNGRGATIGSAPTPVQEKTTANTQSRQSKNGSKSAAREEQKAWVPRAEKKAEVKEEKPKEKTVAEKTEAPAPKTKKPRNKKKKVTKQESHSDDERQEVRYEYEEDPRFANRAARPERQPRTERDFWQDYDPYYAPPRRPPTQSGPRQKAKLTKDFDSDYDRDQMAPRHGPPIDRRGPPPSAQYRGPPRGYAPPMYRAPPGRYGYGPDDRYHPHDGPERPGYYAGSKPYRLDVRNSHGDEERRGPPRGGIPRGHQESLTGGTPGGRDQRDNRNRPRGGPRGQH